MSHPLTRWLILSLSTFTLVALTAFALSTSGQRPARLAPRMAPHYALKMAPARQYALKMAPARSVLLAGSPGLKSKTGLVST